MDLNIGNRVQKYSTAFDLHLETTIFEGFEDEVIVDYIKKYFNII